MPLIDDPWLPYNGDGVVSPVRAAIPIAVYRFDGSTLFELPNVHCLGIDRHDGPDPGSATFAYNLASGLEGAPVSIEEAMSTEFTGDLVVEPGDRLVVQAGRPDGDVECLFDGIALGFGLSLAGNAEGAHFGAVGIAVRSKDRPITTVVYRQASTVEDLEANVAVHLPTHFNPGGKPNAVKADYEANQLEEDGNRQYPVFIDPLIIRDPEVRRLWTVPMAVRYLIYRFNDENYVKVPDAPALNALLVAKQPKAGDYDPTDPSTYDVKDLVVPDTPITGKDWPSAVDQLVGDCGFSMMFRLVTKDDGLPETQLGIYRPQSGPIKDLYLAPRGAPFNPTTHNFDRANLDRNISSVVNQVVVRGAPVRYEVSVVLKAGFPSAAVDGSQGNLLNFDKGKDKIAAADRDKYRVYIFGEAGDDMYDAGSVVPIADPPSLDDVFGEGKYVERRRPGIGKLVTLDAKGKPLDASLAISTDYEGDSPGVWDGSGTWQTVADSTWSLLKDRLGIQIDAKQPNGWKIGASKMVDAPYPAGVVKGVEAQCGMTGSVPFFLRLTCVIEADECCQYVAERRDESPLPWAVERYTEAKDRLKTQIIHQTSEHNDSEVDFADRTDIIASDDEKYAKSEAIALQQSTQSGVLDGSVSIPRFTTYYAIGDRIASIEGRGLGFRTDGDASGLNPYYPVVTGIRWDLDGGQRTTLTLSDAGSRRAPRRTRGKVAVRRSS